MRFSGHLLEHARREVGASRERVAIDVGRTAFAIVSYERGRSQPSAAVLGRLASALGCSVDAFFEPDEAPVEQPPVGAS